MIGIAAAIGAATTVSALSSYFGGEAQRKALSEASSKERAFQREMLALQQQYFDLQERLINEGAGYREAAYGAAQQLIPLYTKLALKAGGELGEYIEAGPGSGIRYQRALQKGFEDIKKMQAQFGLGADSGETGVALGEFSAGMLAADEATRVNTLTSLLAGGQAGLQPAGSLTGQPYSLTGGVTGLAGLRAESGGREANYIAGAGGVMGGLYQSIGGSIADLPLQYQLYNLLDDKTTGTPQLPLSGGTSQNNVPYRV